MKKFRVPVFTEEYAINVCLGTRKEILKEAAKYLEHGVEKEFAYSRGMCWDCFPDKNPLIIVDSDLEQFRKNGKFE